MSRAGYVIGVCLAAAGIVVLLACAWWLRPILDDMPLFFPIAGYGLGACMVVLLVMLIRFLHREHHLGY